MRVAGADAGVLPMLCPAASVTLVSLSLLAAPACGQSAEDTARERQQRAEQAVCSASADVARRVARLDALPASRLDLDRAQAELVAIAGGLRTIRTAAGDLSVAQARQFRAAEASFQQQFGVVLQGLLMGRGVGATGIEADVESGLDDLRASHRATLAPVAGRWCA